LSINPSFSRVLHRRHVTYQVCLCSRLLHPVFVELQSSCPSCCNSFALVMAKKQCVVNSSCVLTMSPLITLGKAPLELYAHFVRLMVQTWCTASKACSHAAAEAAGQRHPQRPQPPPAMLQVHNAHFNKPVCLRTTRQASLQWSRPKPHAVLLLKQCVHQAAGEKPCTLLFINKQQGESRAHSSSSMSSREKVVHTLLHQ